MNISDMVPGLADGYVARLVPCPICLSERGANCYGDGPPHPERVASGALRDTAEGIGRDIAREHIAGDMPQEWVGLDPGAAAELASTGLEPGTDRWDQALGWARGAYLDALL